MTATRSRHGARPRWQRPRGLPRSALAAAMVACTGLAAAAGPAGTAPDRQLVGGVSPYVTMSGDTVRRVGARFGVDVRTLVADNRLPAGARLAAGQTLWVDHRHIAPPDVQPGTIVVNVPQRMLFYADEAGSYGFPVAVGRRGWQTPLGPFAITVVEEDPTWDVPPSIQEEARLAGKPLPPSVPPGPANPLGAFWLGLSMGTLGIHGTNAAASIYGFVTHGCIRLHPDDVAWLVPRVSVGTAGRIVYEPVLLAAIGEAIFLEVHPDVYGLERTSAIQRVRELAADAGLSERIDWARADAVVSARHGVARVVTRGGRLRPEMTD